MQDAGFGPFNRLTLSYATTGNPDSKRLAAVFQAMARQIYVDVRINVSDYALELRALRLGQYQLGYATWLADFDDASQFPRPAEVRQSGQLCRLQKSEIRCRSRCGRTRAGYGQTRRVAESRRTDRAQADLPWLPIRFLSQSEAVGPRVGGYIPNARDYNRSRWLWIKK